MQTTIGDTLEFSGIGLHSGAPVLMRVRPADAGTGVWFKRTDLSVGDPMIRARFDHVVNTTLCTELGNRDGARVSTVEHLMAALAGAGVRNAVVEVDGPELPIMDGSSAAFSAAIAAAGVRRLPGVTRAMRILSPIEVEQDGASARLEPADAFEIDYEIDFADPAIGRQAKRLTLRDGVFSRQLSDSRTFCRHAEVEAMRKMGLARGGSLENAVVVDGARVLNPDGLRHADEFVRHKMLDAVGDLALAGAPIIGRYVGRRAGHGITNALLHALFAAPAAWRYEVVTHEGLGRVAA